MSLMARKQAPELATKAEDPAFPRFNRFPLEIRRMIWKQALPPPIPRILVYKLTTFSRWDPETKDWNATDGPPTVPIPPPALLHPTQESRAFALEHVRIRKAKKARTRFVAPSAYHHITLFVHKWHFPSFVDVYMATTPSAARHLVFDHDVYRAIARMDPFLWLGASHISWDDFSYATHRCRGLRSVALTELDRRLDAEAEGDREPRGYYRAVPGAEVVECMEGDVEGLGTELDGREGPDSIP
ncbi:hypothetical protein Daus18300_000617 [Diaporthe australafricana]|uniref:2EXR domain-containing protein n=1 Tax=Diaporthe australafricana TaxID=127596 RepID=A0ABR3Y5H6_9PEZI